MSYDVNSGILSPILKHSQILFRLTLSLFLIQLAEALALSINTGLLSKSPCQILPTSHPNAVTQKNIVERYRNIPLGFVKNEGQTDPQVRFLARGKGYSLFLTSAEAVICLHPPSAGKHSRPPFKKGSFDVVRMRLQGGNRLCRMESKYKQIGKVNYFTNGNPDKWKTGVKQYGQVRMEDVYPGVDMMYYGNQGKLEYDFLVKPGAEPSNIRLKFLGVKRVKVGNKGELQIEVAGGNLEFKAPVVYQKEGKPKAEIHGKFVQVSRNEIGFEVKGYDRNKPLVIDPVLVYSTYLGGAQTDGGAGIAVDSAGDAYVTGQAASANFPTISGSYQTAYGGPTADAFVSKLNATGTGLIYSTYLGGNNFDAGWGIAVDSAGNAYVTGTTLSPNFPTTAGAYQGAYKGGGPFLGDVFVSKLNPAGTGLVYSTYLGGSGPDCAYGITVDAGGNAYVTGVTSSADFPTTTGAYQTVIGGMVESFVTKLNATGTGLLYSTYLGGSGDDDGFGIAVDPGGSAYVTGYTSSTNFPTTAGTYQAVYGGGFYDAFVTKVNSTGTGLVYSTYLGGNSIDEGMGVAVDTGGSAYVTGYTSSVNFPATAGAYQSALGGSSGRSDVFVTKLNATGTGLQYSTYLGGSGDDDGFGIAVDSAGNAYVTGDSYSTDFPTRSGAYQAVFGGPGDGFVTELNPTGTGLIYSTYLGGNGEDNGVGIAVDPMGNIYVTGDTESSNFPTTAGAYQTVFGGSDDAFVAKFSVVSSSTPTPAFTPTSISSTSSCEAHVWPDPFNPNYAVGGTLKVSCLPAGATVSFYTVSGEWLNQVGEAGGMAQWNGTNHQGGPVSSGIYFYVIQNGSNVLAKGKFLINR